VLQAASYKRDIDAGRRSGVSAASRSAEWPRLQRRASADPFHFRKHDMRIHPTLKLTALAAIAVTAAPPVFAADAGYYYGGLSAGPSRGKLDEGRITNRLTGQDASAISTDERATAFRVFGGYQLNPYIGLEAGYFNLGKYRFTSTVPAGTLDGQVKFQGISFDLVGSAPMSDNLSAIARVGAAYAKARDSFGGSALAAASSTSQSQANVKYGAGLQYAFNASVLVRGEIERYRVSDAVGGHENVNVASLSLVFPFGRAPSGAKRAGYAAPSTPLAQRPEAAPTVVAAAPPPAEWMAAPAAVAPERRRVSFSADSLFGFDNAAVTPAGKLALDAFVQDIQGTQYDTISVEGHTDRLGTTSYNQQLSEQRANAVKAYLVSNSGLDGNKIATTGKSESDPVTKAGDCTGSQASAKLIACLQPDRRVDVELVGTR
jgi:OOP family OmpA-OmpF porin